MTLHLQLLLAIIHERNRNMKELTGYTLKQWLMGIWVLMDEYFKSYTKKKHIKRALTATFYTVMAVLCIADFYALYIILWAVS